MEFSYGISEAEFLRAVKLRRKTRRSILIKIIAFWIFVLVSLILLWIVVQHNSQQPAIEAPQQRISSGDMAREVLTNAWPFLLMISVLVSLQYGYLPNRLRRMYRGDPSLQAKITVNILSDSISTENTAGVSSKTGWNIYDFWREGNGLIILVFRAGTFSILNLVDQPAARQEELRSILSSVLRKK
jgi:hypothetical protein